MRFTNTHTADESGRELPETTQTSAPQTHTVPNDVLLPEVGRLVAQGRSVTLPVKGNSMNPFLVDGRDQVVLSPFRDTDLRPGAVVLALDTEGRFVLHRIVARCDKRLLLRGDGNLQQTETTDTDHVLALMSIARRKGVGYPVTRCVWRIYSRLWIWLFPLRRWLLALFRRL